MYENLYILKKLVFVGICFVIFINVVVWGGCEKLSFDEMKI